MKAFKDKEFKQFMCEYFSVEGLTLNYNSDFESSISGVYYCFEYENSSRGLTSNLVKLLRNLPEELNVHLVFIRTELHEKTHRADFDNFLFLMNRFQNNTRKISVINDCELLDFLKSLK